MNIIIINYHHPEENIVGAIRAKEFSSYLAKQNHRVLVLSRSCNRINSSFDDHDWTEPYFYGIDYQVSSLLEKARKGEIFPPFNKLLIAFTFFVGGGPYKEWEDQVKTIKVESVIRCFNPEIVWSIFGASNCVSIGHWVAKAMKARHFIDIKDPWNNIPNLYRLYLNKKIKKYIAGITTNSNRQAEMSYKYFGDICFKTIYSGCHTEKIKDQKLNYDDSDQFIFHLTGSIYDEENLINFFKVLAEWGKTKREKDRYKILKFYYSGINSESVRRESELLKDYFDISIFGQVTHKEFIIKCKQSSVNCYLWTGTKGLFHHKTLELMACGKPIISYPGEWDETIQIGKECNAVFISCKNQTELFDAIEAIFNKDIYVGILNTNILDWEYHGKDLENFLIKNK